MSCPDAVASPEIFVINAAYPRKQPKPLTRFPNPAPRPEGVAEPLVIDFCSPEPAAIDVAMGKMARRDVAGCLRSIHDARDRSIIIRIDDPGGRADEALAIAQALLAHALRVEAYIVGRCSSSAVYLALASDVRTIDPAGRVRIHQAARICTRSQYETLRRLPAEDRIAIDESLSQIDDVTVSLLTSRLGVTEQTARAWMAEDRAWSAAEAFANGFVHAITESVA